MKKFALGVSSAVISLFAFAGSAWAATLSVSVDKTNVAIGDTVTATVLINSEGTGVNAAQAVIQYPKDLIEVLSVDRGASVFSFWLQAPAFSNETGRLTFTGGTANGVSGASLEALAFTFKVKGTGTAALTLTDGAVTASDGSGTNVLSSMRGAQITSVSKNQQPQATPPAPQQITRPAVKAATGPAAPKLTVPLYPDQTKWYNVLSNFLVRWDLPADVTDVATSLTQNPKSVPGKSEGLFDNKFFAIPKEGIWYVHVQFKNNVGWSDTIHYRVAVDVTPPSPFVVRLVGGPAADFPNPTISYASSDATSHIIGYDIRVDGTQATTTKETSLALPKLPPGKHAVVVSAKDEAGNATEGSLDLVIEPIAAPAVEPIAPPFVGEGGLVVHGTALANAVVHVLVKSQAGAEVAKQDVPVTAERTWVGVLNQPLREGTYSVIVTAEDARGALSLPVASVVNVRQRPILVLGGLEISSLGLLGLFALVLLLGLALGWRLQQMRKQQRGFRTLLVSRDITNTFAIVRKELDAAREVLAEGKGGLAAAKPILASLNRADDKLTKTEKYILENVEELND